VGRKKAKRTAGQGSVFIQGDTTWIRWRQNGRRRTEKFPGTDADTRDLAERALARIIGELSARRGKVDPKEPLPSPPLSELAPDWLARRKGTHRSQPDDASRMRANLLPFFGHQRPAEVTAADVRRFVEVKLAAGLSSTTVGHCVRLLSVFFADLVERGFVEVNPVRALPRSTRRLFKNAHDPRTTPFLERQEDIAALYRALPQPHATVYAVGVLAGLRPGETLALEWGDVDLAARRLTVRRQVRSGRVGPPKNGRPRFVPIADALATILAEWKLGTGATGQLFRPAVPTRGGRRGAPSRFLGAETVGAHLRTALAACKLPDTLSLYHCTRHTYASQFVAAGGSIQKLKAILGHASVTTTERYAHLAPEHLRPSDLPALTVELSRDGGAVVDLAAHREGRNGTPDHGVTMEVIDDDGTNSVSSHSH
jgi:integrase